MLLLEDNSAKAEKGGQAEASNSFRGRGNCPFFPLLPLFLGILNQTKTNVVIEHLFIAEQAFFGCVGGMVQFWGYMYWITEDIIMTEVIGYKHLKQQVYMAAELPRSHSFQFICRFSNNNYLFVGYLDASFQGEGVLALKERKDSQYPRACSNISDTGKTHMESIS